MPYTKTTWTTLNVAQVKGFVIIYRHSSGAQAAAEAPVILVQHDPATNVRREVFAAVDQSTGELIPAPDVPNYIATVARDYWRNLSALRERRDFTPAPGALVSA